MDRIREILDLLANPADVTDEQLADLESELMSLFDEARAEDVTEEVLVQLEAIADVTEQVRTIAAERITEAEQTAEAEAARQARIEELAGRMATEDPDDEEEDDDTEDDTDEGGDEVEDDTEASTEKEPVMAGGNRSQRRLSLKARAKATKAAKAAANQERQRVRMFASADVPGRSAGAEFSEWSDIVSAMNDRYNGIGRSPGGTGERVPVARFQANYDTPALEPNVNEFVNELRQALVSGGPQLDALLAAGGICAPTEPWYGLEVISNASRPVQSSLVQRQVARGGINYSPPPSLADIGTSGGSPGQAIGVITEAQDEAGTPAKTFQTVPCPSPVEVQVEAIYLQLQFGNFGARTWPEQVDAWSALALAAHARLAENQLLAKMVAGSTAITEPGTGLGAIRDVVNTILKASAGFRFRHRMSEEAPLHVWLPRWLIAALQSDVRNNMSFDMEQFRVTVEEVQRAVSSANVVVHWHLDGLAGQTMGAQSAGALVDYPSDVQMIISHAGGWWFLDNGVLDLGLVRDSTLNANNNFQTFTETFESAAFLGVESLAITLPVCPNGLGAGTADTADLCAGS